MVAKKTKQCNFIEHFENKLGNIPVEETYIQENRLKLFNRNCQVLAGNIERGKKLMFQKKKQQKIKKGDKRQKRDKRKIQKKKMEKVPDVWQRNFSVSRKGEQVAKKRW